MTGSELPLISVDTAIKAEVQVGLFGHYLANHEAVEEWFVEILLDRNFEADVFDLKRLQ